MAKTTRNYNIDGHILKDAEVEDLMDKERPMTEGEAEIAHDLDMHFQELDRDKDFKEFIEEFNSHPALKFANGIILQEALRSGNRGYGGEENLTQFLERRIPDLLLSREKALIGSVKEWAEKEKYEKESKGWETGGENPIKIDTPSYNLALSALIEHLDTLI